jgi:RNA polymerase sigma factor (sigma-70 family)
MPASSPLAPSRRPSSLSGRVDHGARVADAAIGARVTPGDAASLVGLERECGRLVRRLGSRFGFPGEELEDLGRDYYVHLVDDEGRRLRAYAGEGSFTAWLTRCCIHFLIDRRRCQGRYVEVPLDPDMEDLAAVGDVEVTALDNLAREQSRSVVAVALGLLSAADRELLLLHYLADLSHAAIAAQLGLPPATVRQRCSRAVRRLRAALGADEQD